MRIDVCMFPSFQSCPVYFEHNIGKMMNERAACLYSCDLESYALVHLK